MMFYLYVLQNQWIAITLLAAVALVLIFSLAYHAMWHPRGTMKKIEVHDFRSFLAWLRSFLPLVIILLVAGSVLFTIATLVTQSCTPPNW